MKNEPNYTAVINYMRKHPKAFSIVNKKSHSIFKKYGLNPNDKKQMENIEQIRNSLSLENVNTDSLPDYLKEGMAKEKMKAKKLIDKLQHKAPLRDIPFEQLADYASTGFSFKDNYDLTELEELCDDELVQVGQADNLDTPVLKKILDLTKENGNPRKLDLVLKRNAHKMNEELIHEYLDELSDYINDDKFDYNDVSDIEVNGGCLKFKKALASHKYTNEKILDKLSKENGLENDRDSLLSEIAKNPNTNETTLNNIIKGEISDNAVRTARRNLEERQSIINKPKKEAEKIINDRFDKKIQDFSTPINDIEYLYSTQKYLDTINDNDTFNPNKQSYTKHKIEYKNLQEKINNNFSHKEKWELIKEISLINQKTPKYREGNMEEFFEHSSKEEQLFVHYNKKIINDLSNYDDYREFYQERFKLEYPEE